MKSKIKIGIMIFFMIIFGYCIKSNAAISTQSKEVKSGEQFTISVTSNVSLASYSVKAESYSGLTFVTSTGGTGAGTTSVSNALASGGVTNLATFTFKAPEVTKDTTYTIKFTAEGMGDENLQPVANSTTIATITVKAPATPAPEQPTTPAKKSTEARLNTFGIRPNDFSGFSKNRDKEEWSTTVPNDVTEVEVYGTALDKNAKVEGVGKVALKEGNNTVKVTVTAEDGKTTKTYTLTIKRKTAAEEVAENGEARLKNLGIKPEEYDFKGFDSEKTEYSAEVPNEVDEIEVYATAMNSSAQITGTGMIELKEGKNELKVEVIAANGAKKTYTLEVTRKEKDGVSGTTEEKFGLASLSIEGLTLKPSFKVGTYEYTVELTEDLASLSIQAKANDEEATVEIYGNENLQQGENVITIQVTNEEAKKMATYQIIVNKHVDEEVVQKSWLKPSTWGQEEKIKIAIIIVLIILIICAIVLKINISKEIKNDNKLDLPGAKELDKAMAEHQELSEEPSNTENAETEDIQKNQIEQNYIEDIAKNKFGDVEGGTDEKAKRKGRHF